ncbi:MAG: hypothetical protein KA807_11960 [Prolixibacteraceae bacterium]|nr:hypothetical protein [Prolixibacteraceae bacterium]
MKTEIIKTDWFLGQNPPEGTVTFKGKRGGLIEAFSYGYFFSVGDIVDIELTSLDDDIDNNVIFSENKNKEIKLVKSKNDWEYEGYGCIKSINPVVIDFGEFELNTGTWITDAELAGEYIYWKIARLDIMK